MRTAFFMISGDTDGESREIGEDVFDGLVRDRAGWDLFAAMKGDLVWACGGPQGPEPSALASPPPSLGRGLEARAPSPARPPPWGGRGRARRGAHTYI